MLVDAFKAAGTDIKPPFRRMKHVDAMEKYGNDKPDLRYDMAMVEVADIFAKSSNEFFSDVASKPHINRVKALR